MTYWLQIYIVMKRVLDLVRKAVKAYCESAAQNYAWRYTGNTFISDEQSMV